MGKIRSAYSKLMEEAHIKSISLECKEGGVEITIKKKGDVIRDSSLLCKLFTLLSFETYSQLDKEEAKKLNKWLERLKNEIE